MAALKIEQESSNQLVLGTALGQRFPNIVSLAVFLLVAFSVITSLFQGNFTQDPSSILVLLFFGFFGLRSIYSAFVTTRINLDGAARSATRTTLLLGIPIGRSDLAFNRVRRVIVGSRLPVRFGQSGSRGGWQVAFEATDAPPFVVNSNGTHDEMLSLGNKIAALVKTPLTDELEQARAAMQSAPEIQPIEGSGGGGSMTYAPPVAVPMPFGGKPPASSMADKMPAPNTLAEDSESPEHARFEQEAAEAVMSPPTAPTPPAPTAMPAMGELGGSTAPFYSAPPALELPDQPPLGSATPASSPTSAIPSAVEEPAYSAPPRRRSFQELQKAIADDPTDSIAFYQLARQLQSRGADDQALEMYQNAVRLDPMNGSVQNDLGVLYYRRGNFKDAETAFRRAVGLDPFSASNRYNLGILLARTGRRKEAQQEFSRVQQNARDDSERQLGADALSGRLSAPVLSVEG